MTRFPIRLAPVLALAVRVGAAPPSPEEVERYHLAEARRALRPFDTERPDPEAIIRALEQRSKDLATVSILSLGLSVVQHAALVGRAAREPRWTRLAVDLADTLYRRYVTPAGTFIERDRAAWIEPDRGWRTIPWGVNFRGNEILDAYLVLKGDLSPEQAAWWRGQLQKLGAWIHRNPILGGLVFNASIDICRLHWRLGKELGNSEWQRWALEAAHARIRRDIDQDGWIHGESGGVSGTYQMVGARHLAQFSGESRDPILEDAIRRVFRGAAAFATPALGWTGNFGTRSSNLMRVTPLLILEAARLGEPAAAYFTQQSGQPDWSPDSGLWKQALAAPAEAPTYQAVRKFAGIESTVLREGPWVIYLCNYRKSIWARGFAALWHGGHGDWVFSSLHTLPSRIEKAKLQLGDTSDWSGLPHIRVYNGKTTYDSHQKMEGLEAAAGPPVTAVWSEPLLDRDGQSGGRAEFRLRAAGEALDLAVRGTGLAGRATVDYHVLHRSTSAVALWAGEEVEHIRAGRLPESGGGYQDRKFPGKHGSYAIQIDNFVLGFDVTECPNDAAVTLGLLADGALHSGNHGGLRLRFDLPEVGKGFTIALRMRKLN